MFREAARAFAFPARFQRFDAPAWRWDTRASFHSAPTLKRLPLYLLLASSIVPALSAAPVNVTSERIREGEVKQGQLRGEAQRLVEQLDEMLGEYERNGLAGEDTKMCRRCARRWRG